MKLIQWQTRGQDHLLTVEVTRRVGGWFRRKTQTDPRVFIGSGTVWHSFPECDRCSTSEEWELSGMLTGIRYGLQDELQVCGDEP